MVTATRNTYSKWVKTRTNNRLIPLSQRFCNITLAHTFFGQPDFYPAEFEPEMISADFCQSFKFPKKVNTTNTRSVSHKISINEHTHK